MKDNVESTEEYVVDNKIAEHETLLKDSSGVDSCLSPTKEETGSEAANVHSSPDVIPSSQTSSSSECSFQLRALRRVSVPLHDVSLNTGHAPKENLPQASKELCELEKTSLKHEKSHNDESKGLTAQRISPIAGRTRRKSLGKFDDRKTQQEKSAKGNKRAKDNSNQHVEDDEENKELEVFDVKEKESHRLQGKPSSEVTSSPVPNSKIKFMRPLLGGGSPVQHRISRVHSPVASPTTSILKRTAAGSHGQTVDSPSPPGKVICLN